MTTDQWTIDEGIIFQRPDSSPFTPPELDLIPGMVRCIIYGTMRDGRRFYNETFVTEEMLADAGEEKVTELLRADARPPSDWQ